MEFILKPVKEKKEYIKVNLGFTLDNHDHLPIIWRNSERSFYGGFAYWDSKVCIVNFHVLYNPNKQNHHKMIFLNFSI